ncbi:MAG: hypothetical protein ABI690_31800 [Chloroflexota bacterium]
MIDLQTLLETIDQLPPDELEQIQEHIERRRFQVEHGTPRGETPDARITILKQAFSEMRDGLADNELHDVIEAMNSEYIEPDNEP